MIGIKEEFEILDDGLALNAFIEFTEERDGFLGARLAEAVVGVEKEIVSCVCRGGDGGV